MSGASPTLVPKNFTTAEFVEAEVVNTEEPLKEEVKVDVGPRPDGWEGVVWDAERALGCPDHCKGPEDSNLVNIINNMRINEKNFAIAIIDIAKTHL